MTKLVTDKGKTYQPDWLFEDNGTIFFRLVDKRKMTLIASEFEDCASIHYECDYYPPKDYYGFTDIMTLQRDGDKINIILGKKVR